MAIPVPGPVNSQNRAHSLPYELILPISRIKFGLDGCHGLGIGESIQSWGRGDGDIHWFGHVEDVA